MPKASVDYPTLKETHLVGLQRGYPYLRFLKRGKTRDIYDMDSHLLIATTDRISTHDVVYKDLIPHKGYGLNQTAVFAFRSTSDIVPNHVDVIPDSNCMIVYKAIPYPIEVIVRGYLAGSAWKGYQKSEEICGIRLSAGMKKNQKLDSPIVTPTTKAETGHDQNLDDAGVRKLIGPIWDFIKEAAIKLYIRGNSLAEKQGAALVDTKFEFGTLEGELTLIDEAFTHDSSRYVKKDEYEQAFAEGKDPKWIDKQFVRDFAEAQGFKGEGEPPRLTPEIILGASERTMEVYRLLSGKELELPEEPPTDERIMKNLERWGIR